MSKTEKHIEYWPNGKKRIEGLVRDGIDEWSRNLQGWETMWDMD